MLKKALILSSITLTLVACSNSNLKTSSAEPIATGISQNYVTTDKQSETSPNVGIEKAILEYYNLQRGVDTIYYSYVKIDLNNDLFLVKSGALPFTLLILDMDKTLMSSYALPGPTKYRSDSIKPTNDGLLHQTPPSTYCTLCNASICAKGK